MSLKNLNGTHSVLRNSWFIIAILFAFLLIGCGEMEEATMEEQQPQAAEAADQAEPADEKPMDQALTSFVGADVEEPAEPAQPTPQPAASPTQLSLYEKQIEELRTDNTGLKQKIVKLEQENRGLNTRISEVEAQYTAEKLRADKATSLTASPVPVPVAVERTPVSASSYEEALQAFKSRRYDEAEESFKSISENESDDLVANRAKYWLGETYFAKKQYKQALAMFQQTLKFKKSEKKADAQYMIAQSYERLGSRAKAKSAYEKVVKNYPMSRLVKKAKARWAKL